jgi:indolepyruvate ferredoxin oxidoreductase
VASRAAGYASIDAEALAEHHLGDAIYTNMVMVGAAWQMGLLPVSAEAVLQAVRLNRVQVDMNVAAFQLGRVAVEDPDQVRSDALSAPRTSGRRWTSSSPVGSRP